MGRRPRRCYGRRGEGRLRWRKASCPPSRKKDERFSAGACAEFHSYGLLAGGNKTPFMGSARVFRVFGASMPIPRLDLIPPSESRYFCGSEIMKTTNSTPRDYPASL